MKSPNPKKSEPVSAIEVWLQDPKSDEFFGQAFRIKFAVLAELVSGDGRRPGAVVAKQLNITRAAVGVHVRKAREVYGFIKPPAKKLCR